MHLQKPLQINTALLIAAPAPALHVARRFTATPEQVCRAWLNPALAGRWLFATATRPMTATITPKPGGRFKFTDGHTTHTGRYLHIQEPHRLAFTLDDTLSRVQIEFAPRSHGCLLRLEHTGLPPELTARTRERWRGMFYGLSLLLASN
jgi:uncharacterized protein YndB with AHSA1/START domain